MRFNSFAIRSTLWVTWWLALLVITVGYLAPRPLLETNAPYVLSVSDKLEHYLSFALLSILPVLAERNLRRAQPALALVLLLAPLLEAAQSLSPFRTVEAADVAANCAGALTGVVVGYFGTRVVSDRSFKIS